MTEPFYQCCDCEAVHDHPIDAKGCCSSGEYVELVYCDICDENFTILDEKCKCKEPKQ